MPDYLEKAAEVVNGDRQEAYGHPAENFARIATMWSSVLGVDVTREQVALCMILLKASRLINQPTHADSWTDIAGYVATVGLIHGVDDVAQHEPELVEMTSEEVKRYIEGPDITFRELDEIKRGGLTIEAIKDAMEKEKAASRERPLMTGNWEHPEIHKLDKPTGPAGKGIRKALTGNAQ